MPLPTQAPTPSATDPSTARRTFLSQLGALTGGALLSGCGGDGGGIADAPAQTNSTPTPESGPAAPTSPVVVPLEPPVGGVYTPTGGAGSITDMIPPPGFTANVSLNNLSDLNPCPAGGCWFQSGTQNDSPWRNWTGAAFASGYSSKGAMVYWGGGHNGGNDCSLYVFDFATALWSRIGPDNPATDYVQEANFANSLLDKQWFDFVWQGNYIVPALHSYTYPAYVPPGVAGVGAKGSWVLPLLVADKPYIAPHAVDMATGIWTRFSADVESSVSQGYTAGSIYDSKRKLLYWGQPQGASVFMLNMNDSLPRTIRKVAVTGGSFSPSAYYPIIIYVESADLVVEFGSDYGSELIKLIVYSTANGGFARVAQPSLPTLHAPALKSGYGVDWCPDTGKFYFYAGYGTTAVYTLKPSSLDFANCSWTWELETFEQPAWAEPVYGVSGGEVSMNRWRYVAALKCFAWCDGPRFSAKCADGVQRDGVMQLWRPLGT